MLPALTREDLYAILRSRMPRAWLDEQLSTPDGRAQLEGAMDVFLALDTRDAQASSQRYVSAASHQVDRPASGGEKAITTLSIRRRRQGYYVPMPARTQVQTPDGHIYTTDAGLSWAGSELVAKTVAATALRAGHPGAIPAGELTQFSKIAKGITGAGLSLTLTTTSGSLKALRFTTDLTKPHPFKAAHAGLMIEIVDVSTLAAQGNVGRHIAIGRVNNGVAYANASAPDGNAAAWTAPLDPAVDPTYSAWYVGAHTFTWRVLDWDDLGFSVTNTVAVSGGRDAALDERAIARGRARLAGESDDAVRARLERAPAGPFPLGVLDKLIAVLNQWAFTRHDVQIYELGATAPDAVDLYAENFPACGGFISDLHCSDMSTPATPDGMASASPTYSVLSPFFNPGLALTFTPSRWGAVVRWDTGGLPPSTVATIRHTLFAALKDAKQPGCFVALYFPQAWSYP